MSILDWIITLLPLSIVLAAGIYSSRFVRGVADFMSANRSAGRYLLCIAGGELQAGAVVFAASFEVFSRGGFSVTWWAALNSLTVVVLSITGFVTYRFRETRAMTLAQFFEIRYSKAFRLFAGVLGFLAGILNFGIIPAIGARTMVYFLNLPELVRLASLTAPSHVVLMAVFLSITAFVSISGGVITVMIVNTIEGIISQLLYLIIIAAILLHFTWPQMNAVLTSRPQGESLVNPFDAFKVADFNLSYILMVSWYAVYGRMAWQNASAYASAGLNPHEGRMGMILTNWREMGKAAVITLLALAAVTYLHTAEGAKEVQGHLNQITDPQAREQMAAPIALANLLPSGVKGAFCVILLMGIFGGDATHLHSWGGILVQDVFVPLRRRPFGPSLHLWVLRGCILGVAIFAFLFGVFFHLVDYINMWWNVTQGIFVGGAGAAIIGGLYWKKGTAAGAWAAFLTGSALSVAGIVVQQIEANLYQRNFFLNGTQIALFSSLISIGVYVAVSLLTCREDFNLNRMLHRGEYAKIKDAVADNTTIAKPERGWARLIGIDGDFSRGDRWIAGLAFGYTLLLIAIFIVVSVWNIVAPWRTETWSAYFHVTGFAVPIFFAVVTGLWFTWGGLRDMRSLFARLRHHRVNALDDGTVVNNQNLDEGETSQKSL